jgi:hypothetical protein
MEDSRYDVRQCPTTGALAHASYRKQLASLLESNIPFLVGGAYAIEAYLGIPRDTKDLDLFVLPADMPRALEVFATAGYRTEIVASHWLSKVFADDRVTDIIFNSGNGLCVVDAEWFEHARPCDVFDLRLHLCPPEETIWQKAFIMERERYDGADVAHLLRGCGETLDWGRLLKRFGDHWPVLLSHLILFRYIFPDEPSAIPSWVLEGLLDRARAEPAAQGAGPPRCRGPLLSSRQYAIDIQQRGYEDPRVSPAGHLTPEQIARWETWLQAGPQ